MPQSQSGVNPAQQEAIRYLDGPCLVIAGAGSGKTRVITHKIARLIEAGFSPSAIAAITFTNKAAREMAERLGRLVRLADGEKPLVSTFHSLGVQMLRRDSSRLGLKTRFSILDSDDALAIIRQALATTDNKLLRAAQTQISLWKNALIDPDGALAGATDEGQKQAALVYREYSATLAAYQAVDFDDLIRLPVQLLREHQDLAQAWREKLRYLLVDEYQDTNACQYELLKLLCGPRAAFTAVGDDDQSIYGWRGATLENLGRLAQDFPALKVIKLEQNYRSSLTILKVANQLIGNNPKLHEKRLWSELGVGDPVTVIACDSDQQEAESIVMRLQAHKFERRTRFSDYAILYRGNHQARVFEQALRNEKIPYVLSGGQSFFDRAEIRDLMAYLRLLANDDDDPALIRALTTPKRGVGAATLSTLGEYSGLRRISMFAALFESGFQAQVSARQLSPLQEFGQYINRLAWRAHREPAAPLLDELVQAIDYRTHLFDTLEERQAAARWQNVCDFLDWLRERANADGSTLLQLAQDIAILSQLDRADDTGDAVRLTTIHAAKGLEFAHVYIAGCEEGLLPHYGSAGTGDNQTLAQDPLQAARIEEERRLMYVAVTRAQRSLTLSWCNQRRQGRELRNQSPSRFIAEMQLDALPLAKRTVSQQAARQQLGRLRELLGAAGRGAG